MVVLGWVILIGCQLAAGYWAYRLGERHSEKEVCRWVELHLIEMGRQDVIREMILFCTTHHRYGKH